MEAALESSNSGSISTDSDVELCLTGTKLYGDDFTQEQVSEWFRREEQAYFELATAGGHYHYSYHSLNLYHGYRHLPPGRIEKALGLGSAYGDEFYPILDRLGEITILDPGNFEKNTLGTIPIRRVSPDPLGKMAFADCTFDLITCFGVLHHIPNVSAVVQEIYRCLKHGGIALIREPIISMGDWRRPRAGLTPCERGIPITLFRKIVNSAGFEVAREAKCVFSGLGIAQRVWKVPVWNSYFLTRLDALLCRFPYWPKTHHARTAPQKIRPMAVYYVLRRP